MTGLASFASVFSALVAVALAFGKGSPLRMARGRAGDVALGKAKEA